MVLIEVVFPERNTSWLSFAWRSDDLAGCTDCKIDQNSFMPLDPEVDPGEGIQVPSSRRRGFGSSCCTHRTVGCVMVDGSAARGFGFGDLVSLLVTGDGPLCRTSIMHLYLVEHEAQSWKKKDAPRVFDNNSIRRMRGWVTHDSFLELEKFRTGQSGSNALYMEQMQLIPLSQSVRSLPLWARAQEAHPNVSGAFLGYHDKACVPPSGGVYRNWAADETSIPQPRFTCVQHIFRERSDEALKVIEGPPGTGKTMASSLCLQELSNHTRTHPGGVKTLHTAHSNAGVAAMVRKVLSTCDAHIRERVYVFAGTKGVPESVRVIDLKSSSADAWQTIKSMEGDVHLFATTGRLHSNLIQYRGTWDEISCLFDQITFDETAQSLPESAMQVPDLLGRKGVSGPAW